MSSKLRLVSPELQQLTPRASPVVIETDWEKCVLCQLDKKEKPICPDNSKKQDAGTGHVTLAEDRCIYQSWVFAYDTDIMRL